jgi:hypothetical protein
MEETDNLIFDDAPGSIEPGTIKELYMPDYNKQEEESPEFLDLMGLAVDDVHVVNTLIRQDMSVNKYDPDFMDTYTLEKLQQDFETQGIDEQYMGLFENVNNQQEYTRLLARAAEVQHLDQEMAKAGGLKSMAAYMAAYATDGFGLVVDAAAGGSTKVGMLRRFLESGGKAAAADLITEAMRTTDGEPVELSELAMGTITAFSTGGLFGIPGNKAAAKLEAEESAVLKKMKDAIPEQETNNGSAGAAAVSSFPKKNIGDADDSDLLGEMRAKAAVEGIPEPGGRTRKAQISHAAWAQRSDSDVVRKMSADVHGVGNEAPGNVVDIPMEMDSGRLKEQHMSPYYEAVNTNYSSWLKETKGKGFLRRQWSHEDFDEFMEMVGDYRLGKIQDAPEQVKQVADADRAFYQAFKEEAIRSGAYDASRFSKDPNWMSRVISRDKLYGMMTKANVRSHMDFKPLVSNAIRKGREAAGLEVDDQLTDVVATAYLNRAWSQGEGGFTVKQSGELDLDDVSSLKELIKDNLPEAEQAKALEIIESAAVSKKPKDAGEIDNMKSRLLLDKDAAMDINGQTFTMADLYENNVHKLANGYANKMSAELAFRNKGYTTKSFEKIINELDKEAQINKLHKEKHGSWDVGKAKPSDVENLRFSLDRMTHQGIRASNELIDSLFRSSSNHVYTSKMGGSGLNAITEAGTLIAARGLKGVVEDLPQIKDLIKSYKTGNPPTQFVADIETMTSGAGSKLAESRASFKLEDNVNSSMRGTLGKVEKITDSAKRMANETNLLNHLTDVSTRYSTAVALKRLDQWANGSKMPKWWKDRSKAWGLGDGRDELIKKWLTSKNVKRGRGKGFESLGIDKMDYATEQAFRQFIHRFNSNMIQKIYSGDLPRMMQTPLGAFIMKFRSFTTAAFGKHTLADANFADSLAAQKLIFTAGLGMFMYANRVYISHPFSEKKREEKLTLENALRSGATYGVNVSLLPAMVDTTTQILNGEPLIGKKRTSGLPTGFSAKEFTSNIPGVSMIDDMVTAVGAPAKLATQGELTQEQVRAIFSVLMLDTFYGTRGIRDAAVEAAPSSRESDKIDYAKELKDLFN